MLPREVQVLLCRWLADPGAGFVTAISGGGGPRAPQNEAARTEPDGLVQAAGCLRVLTVEETAAVLKVKPATVRKLLREGQLPGKRIGKSWRILEEELRQWLATDRGETAGA
ncbi:MAG: helix-turn-helix domain-containing protein [Deltaproteobacteria bacterium]|nr:helix-turn-helix domain-containing protein [Deltaproteobacteria bacterium]